MNTQPETKTIQTQPAPESPEPAARAIPAWEQLPVEQRQELTCILAGMLLKQAQAAEVGHERAC
jgi:hypothetical protein